MHLIEDCLHETDTYKDILPDVSMLPTNSIPDEKLPIDSGKFDIFPFSVDIDATMPKYFRDICLKQTVNSEFTVNYCYLLLSGIIEIFCKTSSIFTY